MLKKTVYVALFAGLTLSASAAGESPRVGIADYQRAERMLAGNIRPKLLNAAVEPIWLPDGNTFWYRHQTAGGDTYVAVDPERANKHPAFDHVALAHAISAISGKAIDPSHLELNNISFVSQSPTQIHFSTSGYDLNCDVSSAVCSGKKTVPEDFLSSTSPDGHWAVFARHDNLWLRDLSNGKERALTKDGDPHFSYGKMPDSALLRVISQTKGFALPLYGIDWSPDSRHVVVDRADERRVPDYHFLQLVPYDGDRQPRVVTVRSTLSGETALASSDTSIIDIKSGTTRRVVVPSGGLSVTHYWNSNGSRFVVMQGGDYSRQETLYEVTVTTGAARAVVHEESPTFLQISPLEYDEAAIRFLPATNEMIWYSQRDGWNHLYLVDVQTGAIKAKITQGDWNVQNIVRVDQKARRIYFTATGHESGEDPYWRHLYSANLDGTDLKLLTPDAADHDYPPVVNPAVALALRGLVPIFNTELVSPSGRYLVDSYSTPEKPPISVLRRFDGTIVMPLETADASAVYAAGWIAPKPFTAKAADGTTDLYGLLFVPANFDAKKKYPIIDAIYNGPQVVTTPHNFVGGMSGLFVADAQAFAQLGFVVVMMDGRGTPMRSKAFQDYIYNNMQEFGLEDHVAAIRQLANEHSYMDVNRVGVYGHSFGGYTTMKAILGYPDFFKVASASAGPYDLYGMYSLDAFFKPIVFANGTAHSSGPGDRPTNWGAIDLTQQADRLKGKLLVSFGDLDENAYPAVTARMVNALIAANKSFDLIYMPNRPHGFAGEPYFVRRRWDFFVRNLLGAEPPNDYQIGSK